MQLLAPFLLLVSGVISLSAAMPYPASSEVTGSGEQPLEMIVPIDGSGVEDLDGEADSNVGIASGDRNDDELELLPMSERRTTWVEEQTRNSEGSGVTTVEHEETVDGSGDDIENGSGGYLLALLLPIPWKKNHEEDLGGSLEEHDDKTTKLIEALQMPARLLPALRRRGFTALKLRKTGE